MSQNHMGMEVHKLKIAHQSPHLARPPRRLEMEVHTLPDKSTEIIAPQQ